VVTPETHWRRALGPAVALLALTAAAFASVPELGIVEYDDPLFVVRNEHVTGGLSWEGLGWAFTSSFAVNWFPLTWLSHMLDYELWGDDVGGFHITNLTLHMANVLLVYGLLLRTTGRRAPAACVAALFAVHPLHVEPVVWISERKGVLSSFFALGMLHAYVGFARAPSRTRQVAVAAWFLCGLASKPMVVTLPFVLLLLDVWPLGRLQPAAFRAGAGSWARRWRESGLRDRVTEKAALWGLMLASIALTLVVQSAAMVPLEHLSLPGRAAAVGLAYARYLELTFWPVGLSPIHLHPGEALPLVAGGVSLLLVVAVTVWAVASLARHPAVAVGWLWFVGMLVPVVGFLQVGNTLIAERYSYLPHVGLFVAVVWPLAARVERAPRWRGAAVAGALGVVLVLAVITHQRVPQWRDTITLFRGVVEADPSNHLAHSILGLGYARDRQDDLAIRHYARAAALRREHHKLLYRIGRRMVRKGDPEAALRAFDLELSVAPGFVPARNERALLWLAAGQQDRARSEFESILEIDPNFSPAHQNLGRILISREAGSEAGRRHLERAVELEPEELGLRLLLAGVLLRAGDPAAAQVELDAARRLAPNSEEVSALMRALPEGAEP